MMKRPPARKTAGQPGPLAQRGSTLIIGLMMIVLITLIVVNAFALSSTNLKAVGNVQVREEAIAAANQAIERVIGSPFTNGPVAQSINVDIDQDDHIDYKVEIAAPTCVRAVVASMLIHEDGYDDLPNTLWNTEWDIDAVVTHAASGASVRVRQGVRVSLLDNQKKLVCPGAAPA